MSKIILFNSPKNVGKSDAIWYLRGEGIDLVPAECKEALHKLTMTLFGVNPNRYWEIYNTRELKETPLPEFAVNLDDLDLMDLECILEYDLLHWENGFRDVTTGVVGRRINLSIREAMIYVSEIIIKPRWGSDWFGQERVRGMKNYLAPDVWSPVFVDDSCAFVSELQPLISYLGQENILLLRIRRDGYTFEGDSRNYIPDGVITNTIDIDNNGTLQEYYDKVETVVKEFLGK